MKEKDYHLGMIVTMVILIIVKLILVYFNIAWMKTVNAYDFLLIAVILFDCGVLFSRNIVDIK